MRTRSNCARFCVLLRSCFELSRHTKSGTRAGIVSTCPGFEGCSTGVPSCAFMRYLLQLDTYQEDVDWSEVPARMTLTIKLDGNLSSFQLANSAPPLSVTESAIAPSARMLLGYYFEATNRPCVSSALLVGHEYWSLTLSGIIPNSARRARSHLASLETLDSLCRNPYM